MLPAHDMYNSATLIVVDVCNTLKQGKDLKDKVTEGRSGKRQLIDMTELQFRTVYAGLTTGPPYRCGPV